WLRGAGALPARPHPDPGGTCLRGGDAGMTVQQSASAPDATGAEIGFDAESASGEPASSAANPPDQWAGSPSSEPSEPDQSSEPGERAWVGASIGRREDPRLLSGRGRFTDDIELPGMLHAAF